MKSKIVIVLLLCALLCGCAHNTPKENTTMPAETILTGWQTENEYTVYILDDGSKATGLQELDGSLYCFTDEGYMRTGWYEENGNTFYFTDNGSAAIGEVEIDGVKRHFTKAGIQVLLVNPWNLIPEDFEPDLVKLDSSITSKDIYVDRSCYESLTQMIADCNKQCPTGCIISGHRTNDYQAGLYNNKVNYYLERGYSKSDAKTAAAKVVAVPGTSEHQLGLAVDIIDTRSWSLTEVQETLPAQKWLMENCWKYGFILRYPNGTTDSTGIIYEPWHYRYVGNDLAQALHEAGLTLEQYLLNITDKKS